MSKAADPKRHPTLLFIFDPNASNGRASAKQQNMPRHKPNGSTVHATKFVSASAQANSSQPSVVPALVKPSSIKGSDDVGNFYHSQAELALSQQANRSEWYKVNAEWWMAGAGGGKTDDEVMTGDEGGLQDAEEGLAFLDRLLLLSSTTSRTGPGGVVAATKPTRISSLSSHNISNNSSSSTTSSSSPSSSRAVDVGAGVGRITKHILLKRYGHVHLVEGDSGWSKRSRVYLGKKRAGRCTFGCLRLEDLQPHDILAWTGPAGADLIWLQWTLQYMTDVDAVATLKNLAAGLVLRTGMLIVKENRPYGVARSDRFQMDTPLGSGRYDITRTDDHHRYLLQQAGLTVQMTEQGDETNTYAVHTGGR